MRTAQEIFDTVVAHLRKQNSKAIDKGDYLCRYRDTEGRKCAVGCLIPDDDYSSDIEGKSIVHLIDGVYFLPSYLRREFAANNQLLIELQDLHDQVPVINWENEFQNIAERFELKFTPACKQST